MRSLTSRLRPKSVLPGFGLTMGFSLVYLSLLVLLPLSTLFLKSATLTWPKFVATITSPSVVAAFQLTFTTAAIAAVVNAVFGMIVAWVLVRYNFPGKRIIDGLVDLPFALPTAVAGICLTTVYSQNGYFGQWLEPRGIKVAFTPLGIIVALIFIGIPFVVRTVQPVIEELDAEVEEASASLGASRFQTLIKVIAPVVVPALLTGFALAFARGIGEYGSVVFISGNLPMQTEILPFAIMSKLEQFDYAGATAIAVVMLLASFLLMLGINFLQWFAMRRTAAQGA